MKVAILSAVPTSGKTALLEVLGGVFSLSQGRSVGLFTTGSMEEMYEMTTSSTTTDQQSADILQAMIDTNPHDPMLLDYGVQLGEEHVYAYEIANSEARDEEKVNFMKKALDNIPVDLAMIELTGDLHTMLNIEMLKHVDCSLFLIPPTTKAIMTYKEVLDTLPRCAALFNMAYVACPINYQILSDKSMASRLGVKLENMYKMPYNSVIQKLSMAGTLDTICDKIVRGSSDVVNLRESLLELMRYIFDSEEYKVIRGIDKWYR